MKRISQDILRALFDYDPEGFLVWKVSESNRVRVGQRAGCLDISSGYWRVGIKGRCFRYHRVIYAWHTGEWPPLIDHRDNDTQNNKIENLRSLTPSQNTYNRKDYKVKEH